MTKRSKIIQVPMDERLLAELDTLSEVRDSSRSAIIRRACTEYLRRVREERLDDEYEEAYRRMPEDTSIGEAQVALAKDVLPKEDW